MAGRRFTFAGRVGTWLMGMVVIGALMGCAPKIPDSMADEDLQTCDATAATIKENLSFYPPPYELKNKPFLVTPGEIVISAPLNGAVFPFEPVDIAFAQPAPDPNVPFRIVKVYVTPIDTISTSEVYHPLGGLTGLVAATYSNLEYQWTPGASGNFIILVIVRNFKNGGNPNGLPKIDFGPPSMAYVCVKINPPNAGDVIPPQAGTVMLIQDITNLVPTITKTLTFTPFTPTLTATLTETLTSTATVPTMTSTFTPKPPTRIPPTVEPPTDEPPPPVTCSEIKIQRDCEVNDACMWEILPTGEGVCKNK